MPTTIAFIGLGAMGLPIASRLLEAGHRLRISIAPPKKLRRWSRVEPSWLILQLRPSSRTDWC